MRHVSLCASLRKSHTGKVSRSTIYGCYKWPHWIDDGLTGTPSPPGLPAGLNALAETRSLLTAVVRANRLIPETEVKIEVTKGERAESKYIVALWM